MALTDALKKDLEQEIIAKLKKKINEYDFSKKSGNPFIDIIFGKFSNIKSFIHGTATMLGSEYEIMARKIAESNKDFVEVKKFVLTGKISDGEKAIIKDIVKDLEESNAGSNYDSEIKKIFGANEINLKDTRITIDLYLKNKGGKEFFIEMKGPDPNKKEVRAAKEDLLNVIAIKKRTIVLKDFNNKVAIIFGIYYNNTKGAYKNWKVSPMVENGTSLLVQETFWDFLGGKNTYKDILTMISKIKDEIYPIIKKKLDSL